MQQMLPSPESADKTYYGATDYLNRNGTELWLFSSVTFLNKMIA